MLSVFIAELLEVANIFNVLHWQCGSKAEHEYLKKIYDLLRDSADKYAELHLFELDGIQFKNSYSSTPYSKDAALALLMKVREDILYYAKMSDSIADQNFFGGLLEEFETSINLFKRFS